MLATVPLILLSTIHERAYTNKLRSEATSRLEEAATAMRRNIDDYLDYQQRAVAELAGHLSRTPLTQEIVSPILKHELSTYDGFFSLVTVAPSGNVISWEPAGPGPRDLRDRDYIQTPLITGKPFVSDARGGRRGASTAMPLVVISAPILDEAGRVMAVLAASLNLDKFRAFGRDYASIRQVNITILDRQDRVVYSNSGSYSFMEKLESLVKHGGQSQGRFFYYRATPAAPPSTACPAAP